MVAIVFLRRHPIIVTASLLKIFGFDVVFGDWVLRQKTRVFGLLVDSHISHLRLAACQIGIEIVFG